MQSITFFFSFIPVIALLLLIINLIFAPHSPYQEKSSTFECGFHSFLGQNRTQFSISFYIFGILFLLFDLELIVIYPYVVSSSENSGYGLVVMLIFFSVLTIGFVFEFGKKALNIESKQHKETNQQYKQEPLKGSITIYCIIIQTCYNMIVTCLVCIYKKIPTKIVRIYILRLCIFLFCSLLWLFDFIDASHIPLSATYILYYMKLHVLAHSGKRTRLPYLLRIIFMYTISMIVTTIVMCCIPLLSINILIFACAEPFTENIVYMNAPSGPSGPQGPGDPWGPQGPGGPPGPDNPFGPDIFVFTGENHKFNTTPNNQSLEFLPYLKKGLKFAHNTTPTSTTLLNIYTHIITRPNTVLNPRYENYLLEGIFVHFLSETKDRMIIDEEFTRLIHRIDHNVKVLSTNATVIFEHLENSMKNRPAIEISSAQSKISTLADHWNDLESRKTNIPLDQINRQVQIIEWNFQQSILKKRITALKHTQNNFDSYHDKIHQCFENMRNQNI